MPTNAITFKNAPKHSSIEMFFIVGLSAMSTNEADQVPQRGRGQENHRLLIRGWTLVPTEGPADLSSPKEHRLCPRGTIAPPPTVIARARRHALRDPTDRRRGCLQKQSSPYIRRVQHTVLSVAGLKGTMSEFELNLLRQRSEEAIRQKARRGELQFLLPVGFCWTSSGKIEKDPDERVQQAIELISQDTELGSVRRVLLWLLKRKSVYRRSLVILGTEDDLEAAGLFEHSCDPDQSHLCRCLCFRQDRNTNSHRERTCTEDRWSSQAAMRMDGLDSG